MQFARSRVGFTPPSFLQLHPLFLFPLLRLLFVSIFFTHFSFLLSILSSRHSGSRGRDREPRGWRVSGGRCRAVPLLPELCRRAQAAGGEARLSADPLRRGPRPGLPEGSAAGSGAGERQALWGGGGGSAQLAGWGRGQARLGIRKGLQTGRPAEAACWPAGIFHFSSMFMLFICLHLSVFILVSGLTWILQSLFRCWFSSRLGEA